MAALAIRPAYDDDHHKLKFPHTRALLAALTRQHKPSEDIQDLSRVPHALVSKVVSLLVEEREDDLKVLLKDTYDMDDEAVSTACGYSAVAHGYMTCRLKKMCSSSCTGTGTMPQGSRSCC